MKKQILTMFTGLFIGAIITGGASAYAAGILAERSNHRIFVDGQEVQMEAYAVNGNNYVKLRDIGKAVGFEVYWDGDAKCVQVESGKPYTGEAPAKAEDTKSTEQPVQTDVANAKQDIIDRTNALRKENGIAALTANDKLMQAAQVRADEMAASGAYSHTRPDGRKYTTVTDCKYVGENIHRIADWALQGKPVSEVAMWSWNYSAGHQKNLLDKNYAEIGVGLARGVNEDGYECWYCVQLFLWNGYTVGWVDAPTAK